MIQLDKNGNKQVKTILGLLAMLEPMEFLGVCRLMNISLFEEDSKAEEAEEERRLRPAEKLIEDIVNKYMGYNRVKRRNFMSLLTAAARK